MSKASLKNSTKGWIVTMSATGINLILGILYIWSIMGKALINEYNWSSTAASLPYTVSIVIFAIVMIFAGRVQDVKGPRLSSVFGGLLLGGGLILSGFAKTPFLMVLTYGLLGGSGIGFCYAATTPPAVKWFPLEKKGLISGIVVSGVGFAAVYISPLTNMLIAKQGVSNSFFTLGFGALVIIVVLSQFLINPPAGYVPVADKSKASPGNTNSGKQPTVKNATDTNNSKEEKKDKGIQNDKEKNKQYEWHEMLKTKAFYKLWIMYAFSASAGLMIIGHLAVIANKQANWDKGFYLVVFLAIFNTLGRIAGGILSDKLGHTTTMRILFILQAVNMMLFSKYLNPVTLGFGAAITGLSYGALFSVFPAAIADYYGTKNLGVNYGFLFTSWGFAGVIGPLLAGRILDITGEYGLSYIVSAVLLIIASVFTFAGRKKQQST
jgi:OFA family oxalate/formate antiporter-like MFS transporter